MACAMASVVPLPTFQSSSGQKAGCNVEPRDTLVLQLMFQSSSGQKAGCNIVRYCKRYDVSSFNPHPARRPDAISQVVLQDDVRAVSILIRPEGRMQSFHAIAVPVDHQLVSILIRPEGRMQSPHLNFLSVLREPPDTSLPICFHCPDHFVPPATIQLRTRTSRLQWFRHWVRVRPPAVP